MDAMKKTALLLLILSLLLGAAPRQAEAGERQSVFTPLNASVNRYTNHYLGYRINIPSGFERDESVIDVRTRFFNEQTTIDIFYDDFRGTRNSFASYRNYGNKSLHSGEHFKISDSFDRQIDGKTAKIMYYSRKKLDMIENDKNYYASAEIPKSSHEVYTIVMKSTSPISSFDTLLSGFSFTDKKIVLPIWKKKNPSKRVLSQSAQRFMDQHFSQESGTRFGIFEPSAPDYFLPLSELERRLDYSFPVIVRYQHMDTQVPYEALKQAKAAGKVVELTLQTTNPLDGSEDTTMHILNGYYQKYFDNYAKLLKMLDYPVLFRLNNEMNGDWCRYSAYHYGKDADLYVELYRYIHDIFEKNGADNVIFIWNPNEVSFPRFSWNHSMAYYPGDHYVDVVGLTGYNTGNYYSGESWRDFESIYEPLYQEYTKRFNHPLMITEFGSASFGGSKEEWMRDMFAKMKKYERIKLAIWWSGTDFDKEGNPARIYRINETEGTMEIAKEGLKSYKSPVNMMISAIENKERRMSYGIGRGYDRTAGDGEHEREQIRGGLPQSAAR